MKTLAGLAFAALFPTASMAADIDYTYAEAGYSKMDTDAQNGGLGFSDGQGYELDGSYALGPRWFLEGDYRYNSFRQFFTPISSASAPLRDVHLSSQSLSLGGGYHLPLSDSVDLLGRLDYGLARTGYSHTHPYYSTSANDRGYVLGLGLRIATDLLEWDLGMDREDLGLGQQAAAVPQIRQGGSESVFSAAARHDFGPVVAGVEYRRGSYQGWRDLLVSLRVNF